MRGTAARVGVLVVRRQGGGGGPRLLAQRLGGGRRLGREPSTMTKAGGLAGLAAGGRRRSRPRRRVAARLPRGSGARGPRAAPATCCWPGPHMSGQQRCAARPQRPQKGVGHPRWAMGRVVYANRTQGGAVAVGRRSTGWEGERNAPRAPQRHRQQPHSRLCQRRRWQGRAASLLMLCSCSGLAELPAGWMASRTSSGEDPAAEHRAAVRCC